LFLKYLQSTFPATQHSPVDQQAQHTTYASLNHYGWISHFPPIHLLRLHQPSSHLIINEIWHAILQLGPVNDGWESLLPESILTRPLQLHQDASKLARSRIIKTYAVQSSKDAQIISNTLPFLNVRIVTNKVLRKLDQLF